MSDVLGARVGSDDPEQIAEVRKSVPKVIAIGAQPTATVPVVWTASGEE